MLVFLVVFLAVCQNSEAKDDRAILGFGKFLKG